MVLVALLFTPDLFDEVECFIVADLFSLLCLWKCAAWGNVRQLEVELNFKNVTHSTLERMLA